MLGVGVFVVGGGVGVHGVGVHGVGGGGGGRAVRERGKRCGVILRGQCEVNHTVVPRAAAA